MVDLQKVNTKLYPDAYLLLRQDHILGSLGGAIIFSSMDIMKSFFQQRIQPADHWKTTFVTPHHRYKQLTVSTIGLTNLPGFFQHRMESILAKYLWFFILVYIDNIIIFSRSKKEHLHHLDRILQLLEDLGVTLSIAKCHFSYLSIKALGHHISRLGLSTIEEKTKA